MSIEDEPEDHCGVVGMALSCDALPSMKKALRIIQHRGQEAAGVAVFDGGRIQYLRGMGLVHEVLSGRAYNALSGNIGTGGAGPTPQLQLVGLGNGELSGSIYGSGLAIIMAGTNTWTLSGSDYGSGSNIVNSGVLILSGVNYATTTMIVNSGVLKITNPDALDRVSGSTFARAISGIFFNGLIDSKYFIRSAQRKRSADQTGNCCDEILPCYDHLIIDDVFVIDPPA